MYFRAILPIGTGLISANAPIKLRQVEASICPKSVEGISHLAITNTTNATTTRTTT
jgi:hypothetical protein